MIQQEEYMMKKGLVRNMIKAIAIVAVVVFLVFFMRQPMVGKILENFSWKVIGFSACIVLGIDIVIKILFKDQYANERKNFYRTK